ncbi:MAG: metallopeptidase TldD-related protein [Candidatus Kapaibacteriales bacterium]
MRKIIVSLAFICFALTLFGNDEEVVLSSLKKEISRFMDGLKGQQFPPYFLGYLVTDIQSLNIVGTFGNILSAKSEDKRYLDIDIRVGSYKLDNTHRSTSNGRFSFSGLGAKELPLEADEKAIRSAIWVATEKAYTSAVKSYQNVLSQQAVKVKEEDTSADFSQELPSKYFENKIRYNIDSEKWKNIVKKLSSAFINYKWLLDGRVTFSFSNEYKILVNSDGSEIAQNQPNFRITIFARTKAEDGMVLYLTQNFFAFEEKELPNISELERSVDSLVKKLDKLRNAPLAETYSGPAILSGEATGVFFHEIFGHRVEGHRQKDPNSSQTFKSFLNKPVLPCFIDVIFDPTLKSLNGSPLSGYYLYDDEGIPAQKVVSVDSGIFKNFIMSRSPIENFSKSNGHGRRSVGNRPVARQSNLIVSARKKVSKDELRQMLIEESKKQGKEYGLFFETVEGGFTFTGRTIPNAFNVQPIIVYKIYVDGRSDELVRGVDLIGTPLTTFSQIIAAGDDVGVFNGICGAESGPVPVSASAPSILVSKIEVQKKLKSEEKPPILSAP